MRAVSFREGIYNISSGQITIIPKPELRSFWEDSPTKPPFGVTNRRVGRYNLPRFHEIPGGKEVFHVNPQPSIPTSLGERWCLEDGGIFAAFFRPILRAKLATLVLWRGHVSQPQKECFQIKLVTSWWFQPIWKISSSNWIISPDFRIIKMFVKTIYKNNQLSEDTKNLAKL